MKFLLLQSLAIPLIQILLDVLVRTFWVSKWGSKWDSGIFLLGLFASWALSFVFLSAFDLLRRRNRWATTLAAVLLALLHAALLITNFFLFRFFGEYLFPGAFAFIADKDYLWDYVHTFGGFVPALSLWLLWGVVFLCLRPWGKYTSRPVVVATSATLVLIAGVAVLHALDHKSEYRMLPDVVAVESLSKHFLRVRDKVWPLHPSKRLPIRAEPRSTPRTVLVIIQESMGTRSLPFMEGYQSFGSVDGGMPRLSKRIREDSAAFVVFQRAYTSSVSTQVSMPSIFSGVSPEESHHKLHCMPMLWDMAHTAGYRTAYFTSQRLRWATMSDFLLNEPIDSLLGREQTDYPTANDMGIDDFHMVETLEAWISSHPKDPLFVVWNTNALHAPHQVVSDYMDLSGVQGGRYEKALYLLDSAVERVFHALEKAGRLDEALILNTADHGENPDPTHPVARIKSYYEEFTRVPLWVHLPLSLRGGRLDQAMRLRTRLPVANVDIAPSLAQLWGVQPAHATGSFPAECAVKDGRIPWRGESLFDSSPSGDRVITILSNNDTRHWDGEGFGLVRGPWRVVLLPDSGRRLYNIDSDPGQFQNAWKTVADSVLQPFQKRIEENNWLKRIYAHHLNRERV